MALEWIVIGYAAGAEAVMVLLLTLPGLGPLRKGLVAVIRNLLKPFLSVVPFGVFLIMDIYWKYENRPTCDSSEACTPTDQLRDQKYLMKTQRNILLIVSALIITVDCVEIVEIFISVQLPKPGIQPADGRC
ncbi:hypothetical protein Ccrd_000206 [Cynara cardunculus var. scolymus]|uniref:Endoplasmic reticulum transmembrane protein n=1 Tax=Cynara cardunculus var. scolymus TaxID=59895 RepID=A0A118JYM1_CYNCS|nr:hypothetical protein Ccrd_000206 [Cynara cardunculus var. scolymus]